MVLQRQKQGHRQDHAPSVTPLGKIYQGIGNPVWRLRRIHGMKTQFQTFKLVMIAMVVTFGLLVEVLVAKDARARDMDTAAQTHAALLP
ncbi:MAG: hypothetical protein AAFR45_10935 [Pseudomonadota bacterium]